MCVAHDICIRACGYADIYNQLKRVARKFHYARHFQHAAQARKTERECAGEGEWEMEIVKGKGVGLSWVAFCTHLPFGTSVNLFLWHLNMQK